ncbi:hypothetical protein WDU94_002905 [Cyamophila willieti]
MAHTMISNTERMIRVSGSNKVYFIPLNERNQTLSSPSVLNMNRSTSDSSRAGKTFLETRGLLAESTNRTLPIVTDGDTNRSLPLQDRPFECKICFKRFSQKQTLRQHILTHTGQRPFQCQICDKSFTQQGALNRHAALHTEAKKEFSCSVCNQSFRQLNNLKRHMNLHALDAASSFQCEICLRQFARKDGLMRHAKKHLSKREMFYCNICEKSFASSITHARHEQNHRKNDEEKGTCQICRGGFVRKLASTNQTVPSNYEVALSSGKKASSSHEFASSKIPLSSDEILAENLCPTCKSKSSLKNVDIHICSICRMEFPSKAKLRTHTELAHMDKVYNFSCKVCNNYFVTRSHLEKHYLVHRNESGIMLDLNIYQCNYCDVLFNTREGIISHLRWHEKKQQGNILEKTEKSARNENIDSDLPTEETGSDFHNEYLENEEKELIANIIEGATKDDSSRKEMENKENVFVNVIEEEIENNFHHSEEIPSDSQAEDSKDSDPFANDETMEEKDFESEIVEDTDPLGSEETSRPNLLNKSNSERSRLQFNIFDDTSKEEDISLRFGNEKIQLIKVIPMEHCIQRNKEGLFEDYSIDTTTVKIEDLDTAIIKSKDFEEGIGIEKRIYPQYEFIEPIQNPNGSYDDNTNDQFSLKSEIDETSEVGSEFIHSETFTEDDRNSFASMNILGGISNLPKDVSLANLPQEIRELLDSSYQIGVSSSENCTQSNEISTSPVVYSMERLKVSNLSNELCDEMLVDLCNSIKCITPSGKIENSASNIGVDLLKAIDQNSENSPINVMYEDNKPIGIVYQTDQTIEVIQQIDSNTMTEEFGENIKHAQTTIEDTKELEEYSVSTVHKTESVISGNESVEMMDEDHEGDIEINYKVADNELESLQQSDDDNCEKIRFHQIEDDTTADGETDNDKEQFVLLEVEDKNLMFLLDERTTSAPNSPRDMKDDYEPFDEKIDDKTNNTITQEADTDAFTQVREEMMYESIGNVKLKRAHRENKREHSDIDQTELSKVNVERPLTEFKLNPNKFRRNLTAIDNYLIQMLQSRKKKSQIKDQIVEEEYVYFWGIQTRKTTLKSDRSLMSIAVTFVRNPTQATTV